MFERLQEGSMALPDGPCHSQNSCSHQSCCGIVAQVRHPQKNALQLCRSGNAVSIADNISMYAFAVIRSTDSTYLLPCPDEDSLVMCSSTHFAFRLALSNDSTKF